MSEGILFPSAYTRTANWCERRASKIDKNFFKGLGALPDLFGAVATTAVALCLFGQSKRVNATLLNEYESASRFLPHLFLSLLAFNPQAEWEGRVDSCGRGWFEGMCARITSLQKKGRTLQARGELVLRLPIQVIARVADCAIALIAVVCSLLTLGYWKSANRYAANQLEAPVLLVRDVALCVLGLLNLQVLKQSPR